MLATIFTRIYCNKYGPSQETSTGERGIDLLKFKCSIVCTSRHHHKSSFVSILVVPNNSKVYDNMTILNNNAKTEVYDNMTIKVVEVEWMVNEEEVVVVKSNCTFVKNVTVPFI